MCHFLLASTAFSGISVYLWHSLTYSVLSAQRKIHGLNFMFYSHCSFFPIHGLSALSFCSPSPKFTRPLECTFPGLASSFCLFFSVFSLVGPCSVRPFTPLQYVSVASVLPDSSAWLTLSGFLSFHFLYVSVFLMNSSDVLVVTVIHALHIVSPAVEFVNVITSQE